MEGVIHDYGRHGHPIARTKTNTYVVLIKYITKPRVGERVEFNCTPSKGKTLFGELVSVIPDKKNYKNSGSTLLEDHKKNRFIKGIFSLDEDLQRLLPENKYDQIKSYINVICNSDENNSFLAINSAVRAHQKLYDFSLEENNRDIDIFVSRMYGIEEMMIKHFDLERKVDIEFDGSKFHVYKYEESSATYQIDRRE